MSDNTPQHPLPDPSQRPGQPAPSAVQGPGITRPGNPPQAFVSTAGATGAPSPQQLSRLPPPAGYRAPQPTAATQDKPFARGFGAGIGLALGVGVVSLALVLTSLLGAGIAARIAGVGREVTAMTSHVWGPTNAHDSMLALNISGVIEGAGDATMFTSATFGYELADQLDALTADDYAGVLLLMDTPGGSIYGSKAIADAVVRYQERTGKKVVAYVQSMAASGGMFAMSPADRIISDYGTFTGSIGVIMGPLERYRDVTALTGNIFTSGVVTTGGITQEYLTQGTGKDFGNPFRDMTEQERANYTHASEVLYNEFVDFVSQHRGIPAERITGELGAFMFDPNTAIDKGLVDEVMGRPDAFRAAATLNGVNPDDTKVVTPAAPTGIASLLGAEARVPGHNVPLSTAAGVQATSQLCVGAPNVLAFAGDLTKVCGG